MRLQCLLTEWAPPGPLFIFRMRLVPTNYYADELDYYVEQVNYYSD